MASTSTPLAHEHCTSSAGSAPLSDEDAVRYIQHTPGWRITEDGEWITRSFKTRDFSASLALAQKIGDVANAENHHPDLELGWGYLRCRFQTHDVGGLHPNDFIMAAKINTIV